MRLLTFALSTFLMYSATHAQIVYETGYNVSTYAGTGMQGSKDGLKESATFNYSRGIATDAKGNVFFTDEYSYKVRKIDANGNVSTIAGSGVKGFADGNAAQAKFESLAGITVDTAGNVYVSDRHCIRKITPNGMVSTFAGAQTSYGPNDGQGGFARFYYPDGLTCDKQGNVYVADYANHRIRKITPTGLVSTVAGSSAGYFNAQGGSARFYYPRAVAFDNRYGDIYVADASNHVIRKITSNGSVSTYAGSHVNGSNDTTVATLASFDFPSSIAIDSEGNIYVEGGRRVRKISAAGAVTTIAGGTVSGAADGKGELATFKSVEDLTVDNNGNIYVIDITNYKIRLVNKNLTTGVNDLKEQHSMNVYPNPANNVLNISFDDAIQTNVLLLDAQGKVVAETGGNAKSYILPINHLQEGMYFVKITSVDLSETKKVFIVH